MAASITRQIEQDAKIADTLEHLDAKADTPRSTDVTISELESEADHLTKLGYLASELRLISELVERQRPSASRPRKNGRQRRPSKRTRTTITSTLPC